MKIDQHRRAAGIRYKGMDNLEVMQEAVNYNRFLRGLVRRFARDTSAVCDFGAGIGTFSTCFDIPRDRVTCIELDPGARTQLRDTGLQAYPELAAVGDDRFSYVFTLNVLEHIEDDLSVVSEFYRVLQPGGRLFVYVPAFQALYSAMDAKIGHHRRYRLRDMTSLLSSVGFRIEKCAYTDALGFFATLAYKWLDKRADGSLNLVVIRYYDRYLFPISRILSLPLARVVGKNLYVCALKPGGPAI